MIDLCPNLLLHVLQGGRVFAKHPLDMRDQGDTARHNRHNDPHDCKTVSAANILQ